MKYEHHVNQFLTDTSTFHLVAGLCAECGEVAGIFQKSIYKKEIVLRSDILSELGDVLFYLTALATKYDFTLDDVKTYNIDKLQMRHRPVCKEEE